jgi:hypothetical protein
MEPEDHYVLATAKLLTHLEPNESISHPTHTVSLRSLLIL